MTEPDISVYEYIHSRKSHCYTLPRYSYKHDDHCLFTFQFIKRFSLVLNFISEIIYPQQFTFWLRDMSASWCYGLLHNTLFHACSDAHCGDHSLFHVRLPSSQAEFIVLQYRTGLLADTVHGTMSFLVDKLKECAIEYFLAILYSSSLKNCALYLQASKGLPTQSCSYSSSWCR